MNDTRNYIKRIKPNPFLPGKVFLAQVYEAGTFTGRLEILTAGTCGSVLLSMQ